MKQIIAFIKKAITFVVVILTIYILVTMYFVYEDVGMKNDVRDLCLSVRKFKLNYKRVINQSKKRKMEIKINTDSENITTIDAYKQFREHHSYHCYVKLKGEQVIDTNFKKITTK